MSRTSYYVDGFNLYHAIKPLECPELKWLNLHALATSFLRQEDTLAEVTYFTAMMMWNAKKCRRHRAYIDALSASGVRVVESKFLKSNRFCQQFGRYCDFREEKQTDAALAVKVLRDAQMGSIERAILVTADSLLPRNVLNAKGRTVAVCPARYLPRGPCHSHPVGEL